ncbi:MAG: M24 family metallopeptidase [Candidatus Aminicenantes bacterium]
MSNKLKWAVLVIIIFSNVSFGHVLTKKEWELKTDIAKEKIDKFLLPAMRDNDIDMWIVLSRENNHDPILSDIGGGIGGHRNAYIFIDAGTERVVRNVIGTHLGDIIQTGIYDEVTVYGKEGLKPHLKRIVEEFEPKRIGINTSETIPMCDGLTYEMKKYLENSIGKKYSKRLVSAENLIVSFRAHRVTEEVDLMKKSFEIAKQIHSDVLTEKYIKPGKTTAEDLFWAYRDKLKEYRVEPGWPGACPYGVPVDKGEKVLSKITIEPGDFIDVNFGVNYLGYCSDVNRQAYVLRPGEKSPPKEIRELFDFSLQFAEQLKKNMKPGKKALSIYRETMAWLNKQDKYDGWVGAHTIGNTVHGIGPLIYPDYPHRYGDRVHLKLDPIMLFAIELGVSSYIKEFNKTIGFTRQDDAVLTEEGMTYLSEPQTELILIKKNH